MVFLDFQVARVSRVLQGILDFLELMEQEDLKETKVILQVSSAYLAQRVSQVALDVQDISECLESRACLALKGPEDHLGCRVCLAPLDHLGVQVIKGFLGRKDIQEKWGILAQEASWEIQAHQVFQE